MAQKKTVTNRVAGPTMERQVTCAAATFDQRLAGGCRALPPPSQTARPAADPSPASGSGEMHAPVGEPRLDRAAATDAAVPNSAVTPNRTNVQFVKNAGHVGPPKPSSGGGRAGGGAWVGGRAQRWWQPHTPALAPGRALGKEWSLLPPTARARRPRPPGRT